MAAQKVQGILERLLLPDNTTIQQVRGPPHRTYD